MTKFAKIAIAAAIAGFGFAAQANAVIDDFSVNQANIPATALKDTSTDGSGLYNSANGAVANLIGGQRDIYVERLGGTGGALAGVAALVDGGTLSFSTDAKAFGRSIIKWDGATTGNLATASGNEAAFMSTLNVAGLGNYNLAATGSAFLIDVNESDLGFDFGLTVYTSATEWTTLVLASVAHHLSLPASSPIMFADFFGAANETGTVLGSGALRFTGTGGSADMSNVGAMLATINWSGSDVKVDMEIEHASTVPEPTSLALVGVALLGLGAARRRKSVK